MLTSILRFPLASPRHALVATTLLLAACNDSGGDTGTDSATGGSSAGTTDTGPTSTSDGSTTTGTGPTEGSGGLTGSSGGTTDAPTGSSTDSGVSATTTDTTDITSTSTSGDTTTGTSGETTGTSGETTGTSGDTTTGETTGETTTGGIEDLPTSCLDVDFPVTAQLCGAGGPVCVVKRDELVSAKQAFRNDMPAIALRGDCGPAVLYSEAVGGYFGFYGERTGADAWTIEPTPMSVATGSLEFDPGADQAVAIVDDGAFGVTLWQRPGGVWAQTSALVGMNHIRAPQLVRDAGGKLHIGHIDDKQGAFHEVFDGAWSKNPVDMDADIHVRLALDVAAEPRLSYWSSKEATWKLYFAAPPAQPEVVASLQSNVLDRPHTSLVLVGAKQTPWVLMARMQPDQVHHDLVLLHRTGPANWAEQTLVAEDAIADKTCEGEPVGPGQQCDYDYVRFYPLALFSAKEEVRALYAAVNFTGTLIAECQQMPFPFCFWAPQSDASTSELRIAWPDSDPQQHQVVAADVFTDRATGRLDPGGNMHLAFYDRAPGAPDPVVRYVAIGP